MRAFSVSAVLGKDKLLVVQPKTATVDEDLTEACQTHMLTPIVSSERRMKPSVVALFGEPADSVCSLPHRLSVWWRACRTAGGPRTFW